MTAFFANVELFDPTGPDRVRSEDVYGGESRLFVLDAPDLDTALRELLDALALQKTRIDRLHKAAPADQFEQEDFPFAVDLEAMVNDAVEARKICVTPDNTFSPYSNHETGLCYGLFEFFDPSHATGDRPYAGEFAFAAVRAATCGDALMEVLNELSSDGCVLISIEDFSDAGFYEPNNRLMDGTLGDFIVKDGIDGEVIWAEESNLYGSEDDE